MAHWTRKLEKALRRKGCTLTLNRSHGHLIVTRLIDGKIICDFITEGMDKQMLLRNMEILWLAVTQ